MDRKMILSILAFAVFAFIGIMLLLPDENIEDQTPRLPWQVEQDGQGRTQVFGFTLGETTLGEIRRLFQEEGEINLFARLDPDHQATGYVVEAYFDQIYLNRIRGDFVIGIQADPATLGPMYERGLRISQLGSGAKKVKLDPADIATLETLPISTITYLPWKSLDAEIVAKRFGTPAEQRLEPETGVTHWLYPDKGMDLAMDKKGGVVIQYVNRDAFADVIAPLEGLASPKPGP
ncbi:MAG: hypothetical protein WBJ41_01510 [Chromatiaceae bacterium]